MDIIYEGEHIWPGLIGNFSIVLAFSAALLALFAFYRQSQSAEDATWKNIGRIAFRIHSLAILGIIFSMLYILFNHYYEYQYAWKHLNNEMPLKYIFSCFWEGQEGSFILWMFWHGVLANFFLLRPGKWEAPVMTIIAMVQVFLTSMLLGIYFGEFQLGQNPFLLMREVASNYGLPWTKMSNYLSSAQFQNGMGLNPLLQNYWMTIHPPTLFLGFASTLMPFAFALAGLWKRDYSSWIKPAIPWAFFGVSVLGTGILMGGAWAYEALGFGGFWAWDPVENTSLVPWLVLLGGAHLLLVNKRKNNSLFSAFLLITGSFILVLFSTFMTRSGVLGDTSVHSFVDSGILPQLLFYLLFFVSLTVGLLITEKRMRWFFVLFNLLIYSTFLWDAGIATALFIVSMVLFTLFAYRTYFPRPETEEHIWSREFWMFIGALVLVVSTIHIIVQTSVPIGNILLEPFADLFQARFDAGGSPFWKKLADHNFAPPADVFQAYHRIQVPLAFVIFMLIAVAQFFKYKNSSISEVLKRLLPAFAIALGCSALLFIYSGLKFEIIPVLALVFATIFAFTANLDYLLRVIKGKLDYMGASVAHMGFALLIFGAVFSTSQQTVISQNKKGDIKSLSQDFDNQKDMAMYEGDTILMGDYFVSYAGKYRKGAHLYTIVNYLDKVPKTYSEGSIIHVNGFLYYCIQEHVASELLVEDIEKYWSLISMPKEADWTRAQAWQNGNPGDSLFSLEPSVLFNEAKGNSREPSIHHQLSKDVYSFLKYVETETPKEDEAGFLPGKQHVVKAGDRVLVSNIMVSVDSILPVTDFEKYGVFEDDIVAKVVLRLNKGDQEAFLAPLFIIRGNILVPDEAVNKDFGLRFSIAKLNPNNGEITLNIWEHASINKDFIVMQAIIFPQINILWLGCIIMVLGSFLAIRHRIRESKKQLR